MKDTESKKASEHPDDEGMFDRYTDEDHVLALLRGTKGGTGREDVPPPGTLLSDIATSWSRPFSGDWPEQDTAEQPGSREMLETIVQNRAAERVYAKADKPGDRRYDTSDKEDSDDY